MLKADACGAPPPLKSGWPANFFWSLAGGRVVCLQAAVALKSVKGLGLPSLNWSARQKGQSILAAEYGKPNSDANHSKSPLTDHSTPFLILLPLCFSMGSPALSFLGTTPSHSTCQDQAKTSIILLQVSLVMASFGRAEMSIWLWVTALLESRHLAGTWQQGLSSPRQKNGLSSPTHRNLETKQANIQAITKPGLKLRTWILSTSVKGAASPCKRYGTGSWLGCEVFITCFSSGVIWGLFIWLLQKAAISSSLQHRLPKKLFSWASITQRWGSNMWVDASFSILCPPCFTAKGHWISHGSGDSSSEKYFLTKSLWTFPLACPIPPNPCRALISALSAPLFTAAEATSCTSRADSFPMLNFLRSSTQRAHGSSMFPKTWGQSCNAA